MPLPHVKLFQKTKKKSGAGLITLFSAYFLKKTISLDIFFELNKLIL